VLIFDHSGAEKLIRPARQLRCCSYNTAVTFLSVIIDVQ